MSETVLLAIHADQLRAHGGALGLRDEGLLRSALDRPRNRFHYEPGSDLARLAAAHAFGIARNHPFVDGNKRVAFLAMYVFLGVNGLRLDAPEGKVVEIMLALAAGQVQEAELAEWIRKNSRRVGTDRDPRPSRS